MSTHRVITTREQFSALTDGTVIIDDDEAFQVGEMSHGHWYFTGIEDALDPEDVQLPVRVLLESWER